MKEAYDVIIVGAGVSGLMLAHYLDKTKLRVLLLEKKKKIQVEPKSFGTFTETAKEHGLGKFIGKYFDTWAFYGPTVKAARIKRRGMCLVNYNKWVQQLKLKRVDVKTGILLIKASYQDDGICLTDSKQRQYNGKVIVDSSGFAQIVLQLLHLETNKETGLSYEVELRNCNHGVKNEASFILNFNASNSGGWHYALSKTTAQYGWADFYPDSQSSIKDLRKRVLWAVKNLPPHNAYFKNAKITYSYGRSGPSGKVSHKVHDRLIAIGDAGGCGTPATLEGFREAVDSAKMAHETIVLAKEYSKKELVHFSKLFHQKYGRYYRVQHIIRYAYLHWMRNEDIDRWLSNFKKLDDENFFRLIKGEHTLRLMLSTFDAVLVKDVFLSMINNNLPSFLQFRKPITPSKKEVIYETG